MFPSKSTAIYTFVPTEVISIEECGDIEIICVSSKPLLSLGESRFFFNSKVVMGSYVLRDFLKDIQDPLMLRLGKKENYPTIAH